VIVNGAQVITNSSPVSANLSSVSGGSVVSSPQSWTPVAGSNGELIAPGRVVRVTASGSDQTIVGNATVGSSDQLTAVDDQGVIWAVNRAKGSTTIVATDPTSGQSQSYPFELLPVAVEHQGSQINAYFDPQIKAVITGGGHVWLITANGTTSDSTPTTSTYAAVYELT